MSAERDKFGSVLPGAGSAIGESAQAGGQMSGNRFYIYSRRCVKDPTRGPLKKILLFIVLLFKVITS